jgi:hypothetical protein
MTVGALLRRPAALTPLGLSAAALLAIAWHVWRFGPAPQADEGTAAHLWQLLMLLQVVAVCVFAVKWLPEEPKPALLVLALQLAGAAAAVAPVLLLGW